MTEDEIDSIRVGDVLEMPESGTLRIVRRRVNYGRGRRTIRYRPQQLHSVVFAIRHCSWTRGATTSYERNALRAWAHTGRRVRLRSKLDREIVKNIGQPNTSRTLTCCDVEGVA